MERTKREATQLAAQQRERGLLPHPPHTTPPPQRTQETNFSYFFLLGTCSWKLQSMCQRDMLEVRMENLGLKEEGRDPTVRPKWRTSSTFERLASTLLSAGKHSPTDTQGSAVWRWRGEKQILPCMAAHPWTKSYNMRPSSHRGEPSLGLGVPRDLL